MAEGARLESVYTARYPGFESLSLRHIDYKSVLYATYEATKDSIQPDCQRLVVIAMVTVHVLASSSLLQRTSTAFDYDFL